MPPKQVKQSTFDAIVREAIEDFGLTPEEAIAEAREQLKKAGVTDFSNISTELSSVPDEQHLGLVLPRELENSLQSFDTETLVSVVSRLAHHANESREVAGVAGANDAVYLISKVLQRTVELLRHENAHEQLVRASCDAVSALCGSDEVNRSRFVTDSRVDGISSLIQLLAILAENPCIATSDQTSGFHVSTFVSTTTAIASVQRQNEKVKQRLAAGESLDHLLSILSISGSAILDPSMTQDCDKFLSLFTKSCLIARQLLNADDSTTLVSETYNRARVAGGWRAVTDSGLRPLSTSDSILQILYKIAAGAQASSDLPPATKRRVLTECIHTVRLVAVSDEMCSDLMQLGFQEVAFSCMREHCDTVQLLQVCMALLKNLAGRDQCKTPISEHITIAREVTEKHMADSPKIVEQYCGLLSSLCLRRTDIATLALRSGSVDVILDGMSHHVTNSAVQRIGCQAIRNMCARDGEPRRKLQKSERAEKLIRKARQLFPSECEEVAYSALRELDVLVEEELRRDERYTMPHGFYNRKIVRSKS